MSQLGYDDTPVLPNSQWRVHDGNRPQPRVVDPGTAGLSTQPAIPPSDAIVLFDGSNLGHWIRTGGGEPEWNVENGYMEVASRSGNIETKQHFGDCQLHLEWSAPVQPKGDSQGRGNSGVFLMGLYEIQVLDCFNNPTYSDGITAAVYGEFPPLVNACRKPGEWQSYDIVWITPRFEGDKLVSPAYLTVLHNGIVVHHHCELIGRTSHKRIQGYIPHPPTGPIMLQDHGDPVRFRNIWVRELRGYDAT